MGKKRTKETQQQTITPTNPAFVTQPVSRFTQDVNALRGADPLSFVVGASPLQQQAFNRVGALTSPDFGEAGGIVRGVLGQDPNLLGDFDPITAAFANNVNVANASLLNEQGEFDVSPFLDPFLEDVVGASLGGFDENAARERARLAAAGARGDAFGGSRFGVAEGVLGGEQGRNRGILEAGLRSQGFAQAAGLLGQETGLQQQRNLAQAQLEQQSNLVNAQLAQQANIQNAQNSFQAALANQAAQESAAQRGLQGAGILGNLEQQGFANDLTNLGFLADLGAQERAIAQASAQAPLDLLRLRGALLGQAPLALFTGQESSGTRETVTRPGFLGALGILAQGAGNLGIGFG